MNIEVFTIPSLQTHREISEFCFEKLKEICAIQFDYEVALENMCKGPHGKPYFANNDSLHFNISHTDGMGAIVVDSKPCGVDIERMSKKRRDVSKRFFAEDEWRWVADAGSDDERVERMLTVWTGKEAYTKMLGCGLTIPLNSFSVMAENIAKGLEYIRKDDYIVCICSDVTD